jgi:hypothetical protein
MHVGGDANEFGLAALFSEHWTKFHPSSGAQFDEEWITALVEASLARVGSEDSRTIKFEQFVELLCFAPLPAMLPKELQCHLLDVAANVMDHKVDLSQGPLIGDTTGGGQGDFQAEMALQIELEARHLTPRENTPRGEPLSAGDAQPIDAASANRLNMASEVSGISIEELPDVQLIERVATKLFALIDADDNGCVSKDELIDACLMYDERVPIDGIEDTFEAVESFCDSTNGRGLEYDQFFMWCILMFGDCSNEEFASGTREFASAVQRAVEARENFFDEDDSDFSSDE